MKQITRFVMVVAIGVGFAGVPVTKPVMKDVPAPPICWPTCTNPPAALS